MRKLPIKEFESIEYPVEKFVVIRGTEEQLRDLLGDEWDETTIYKTKDGTLFAFMEGRDAIFITEPTRQNRNGVV